MDQKEYVVEMIDRAIGTLKTNSFPSNFKNNLDNKQNYYVAPARIAELKSISSANYDTTRLVKMCEELNHANSHECLLSVAMLTRAIIDHVPPLLECEKFTEVANNYKGTKSFKKSMKNLEDSSRNISDSYLHTPIQSKEILPSSVQVNFSQDLDVLFQEIIRKNSN